MHRLRRARRTLAAVGIAATLALLAACTGTTDDNPDDQTLLIGIESEPDVLDPNVGGGWITWRIYGLMYESLVQQDLLTPSSEASVPEIQPALAETWEVSDDGLTYTFHLREGVTFSDGTPFDAAAVEYNIRRVWDESAPQYSAAAAGPGAYIWSRLSDVEVVDDLTVVFRMSSPFSPFLRLLAEGYHIGMISPTALEEYGNEGIADHPTGTGPFTFVERVRGQYIKLARNDDYWGRNSELTGVTFVPLPDASARVAALRNGEVDVIAVPDPDSVDNLRDEGFSISDGTPPHVWYLSFNMKNQYTAIKEVRQAINLAIDRQGMADELLQGTADPAYDIQSPANAAYVERLDAYERDVDRARELLASVGLEDGFEVTLATSTDGSGQIIPVPMAEYIQQNLAEVGIDVTIDASEWISYLGTYAQGFPDEVGMAQMSWGMTTPYWLDIILNSENAPPGSNVGYYANAELDALMAKAISSPDEDEANALWVQAMEIATEDAAIAPIVNDRAPYVLAPHVNGWVSASEERFDLTFVTIEG